MPPPGQYELQGVWINPKKGSGQSKAPRLSIADVIEKESQRNQKPEPGSYNPKSQDRIVGAFNLKSEKSPGFISDAQYLSQNSPGFHEAKYDLVTHKSLATKFYKSDKPISRIDVSKSNSPPPGSYDIEKSFKETQLQKPRFFISKGEILRFSDLAAKHKKQVPPPGAYDFDKSYDKIHRRTTSKRQ